MRYKNMAGQRFGMLLVKSFAGISDGESGLAKWNCLCDCGTTKEIFGSALRRVNGTKSCGCTKGPSISQKKTVHGMTRSPEWLAWRNMRSRCYNPGDISYAEYGQRGITVCDAWLLSFQCFFEDMGLRPAGTSLDRIDTNGAYEPRNCRWANAKTQALNRRTTIVVSLYGEEMARAEFARRVGCSPASVAYLMNKGMSPEEIYLQKSKMPGASSQVEGALVELY